MPVTITLKTAEEVLHETKERLPSVYNAADIDVQGKSAWVWMSIPKGVASEEDKAVLKDIGFNWSHKRKSYFHTAATDPRKLGRRGNYKGKGKSGSDNQAAISKNKPPYTRRGEGKPKPRPVPKTTNVADEFARRFLSK
jgi:hypothetical protein